MKPTLTALCLGQLCPADQPCSGRNHQRKLHALDLAVTHDLEHLRRILPEQDHKNLDHCVETIYERQALSETDAFINGFSLGVKLIIEAEAEY